MMKESPFTGESISLICTITVVCTLSCMVLSSSPFRPYRPLSAATSKTETRTAAVNANDHVQTLHSRIEEALRGSLDTQWEEVLAEWTEAAPSERKAVRAYVSGLRNRMLRALLDIETQEELARGLAMQYIEVKCHWTMLNTQIQHQTARNGEPEEDLIYRATCVSLIIQSLEPLLSQDRVDNLTAFLAEPLE